MNTYQNKLQKLIDEKEGLVDIKLIGIATPGATTEEICKEIYEVLEAPTVPLTSEDV